jgi:hypothetical protein
MLLEAQFPHEPFNTLVRQGNAGAILGKIMEEIRPESVYFTEMHGHRCGIFVINVKEPSEIPRFGEPLFLNFNADCRFRLVLSPEDLQKAGLDELGKKWGKS